MGLVSTCEEVNAERLVAIDFDAGRESRGEKKGDKEEFGKHEEIFMNQIKFYKNKNLWAN